MQPYVKCLDLVKYANCREARLRQYGEITGVFHPEIQFIVATDGIYFIKNAIDIQLLKNLRDEANKLFEEGQTIKGMSDNRFGKVEQPLHTCRSTIPIAFHPLLIEIATDYFGCKPGIGTCNLRRSYLTDKHEDATELYHTDRNAPKILKFFFYLNDVTCSEDGPFTYIKGSDNDKPVNCDIQHRWTDEEIYKIFGKEREIKALANFGDMIIANTRGIHKGTKCTAKERTMFTINYVVHPEDWNPPTFKMYKEDFESLSDFQKPCADFLIKV